MLMKQRDRTLKVLRGKKTKVELKFTCDKDIQFQNSSTGSQHLTFREGTVYYNKGGKYAWRNGVEFESVLQRPWEHTGDAVTMR